MKHPSRLADLTTTDLVRLHRIQERLNTLGDAIAATSLQAKPAILKLLSEAYCEAGDIFAKGARALARNMQAGWVPSIGLGDGFGARVMAVLQAGAQPPQPASEDQSAPPHRSAGELSDANPPRPASEDSSNPV